MNLNFNETFTTDVKCYKLCKEFSDLSICHIFFLEQTKNVTKDLLRIFLKIWLCNIYIVKNFGTYCIYFLLNHNFFHGYPHVVISETYAQFNFYYLFKQNSKKYLFVINFTKANLFELRLINKQKPDIQKWFQWLYCIIYDTIGIPIHPFIFHSKSKSIKCNQTNKTES